MKKLILACTMALAVSAFSGNAFAQNGYILSVENRLLNAKDTSAFVVEIDRAVEKDVVKAWKKAVERNKVKAAISDDQLTIKGIVIESVSMDSMDIYSTIVQNDKSVKVYSSFIVAGERIDPNGKEGTAVKVRKLLGNFGAKVYREVLERELDEKEKELKDLTKLREKNLKSQDQIDKDIQNDSLQIGVEETEISLLKGQLVNATDRYSAQKAKLASVTDKDALKEEKAKLKEYEKERKDIEKDIKKHSDKILSLKADIRDNQHRLKQLGKEHQDIEDKIVNQHGVVKAAEEELRTYPKPKM
jgi:hypothetical protein